MRWPGDWELCRKLDCRDDKSVSFTGDSFHARQWLQSAKSDVFKMLAMRDLLLQEHFGSDPARMSDDQVINQIAELLISDRLHIHVQPMERTVGPTSIPIAGGPVKLKAAPPPSRKAVTMDDPPTLPSDIDFASQAATLVAAADSGAAVCPT
jgi:hypothetical protein